MAKVVLQLIGDSGEVEREWVYRVLAEKYGVATAPPEGRSGERR